MKTALKVFATAIAIVLFLDVFGFVLWVASGQTPADNFYLGTITAHLIQ